MKKLDRKTAFTFAGGIFATLIAKKMLKSEKAHDLAVKAMAKGINIKKDLEKGYENLKECADDLAHEARKEASRQKAEEVITEVEENTL